MLRKASSDTKGKLCRNKVMAEQANGESTHLRPACVACTYHCNTIHGDRVLEEEKFDPDRSWPFFRKKVSKLSVHQAPQSAIVSIVTHFQANSFVETVRVDKKFTILANPIPFQNHAF
jgi:peptide methionine sulfoxide reductase MsrB